MRRRGLWVLAFALLGACHRGAPEPNPRAREPGQNVSAVHYALVVQAPTRSSNADPRALSLRTNRGYQVTLTRAQLSSYGAALVPCVARPPEPAPVRGASLLRTLFLPRAHAGHTGQRDPSFVGVPALEDLRIPGERALGTRSFAAARYCRVHYLVAAPDAEGAAGSTPSLLLEGSARGADGAVTRLAVRSALAHGRSIDLPAALAEAPSEESTLAVTFTRSLDGLLDDLELASADAKEIERGALRNLVAQMKIDVRWR